MKWQQRRIGDLCKVGRGSSPRPINDDRYFENGEIPWIKVADATASGKYLYETKEKVNQFGASFSRLLPVGSLIICTSGTLGLPIFLGVEGCIHDGWLYTYDYDGLSPEFFYYFLQTQRTYFASVAYGAAIQNINTEILRNATILLPSLDEQDYIANTLKAYDDLIENNRRRMGLLEEAARLLYREWFVRLRFPGYKHARINNGIPEGWEKKRLDAIAEVNRATLPSGYDGEIEYVDIASVTPGQINETTTYAFHDAPSRARRIVHHGDIIWSCVRPNRRSHAVIWKPSDNLIVSTGFAVITPTRAPTTFIYFATTTDAFVGYLENHARGAAYPAVVAADFERVEILVPPKRLLESFDETTEPTFSQIHNLRQQNEKLRVARDLLLPRLMNGEIAV
jgi:type I restriction enzyme S subunit